MVEAYLWYRLHRRKIVNEAIKMSGIDLTMALDEGVSIERYFFDKGIGRGN